MLKGRQLIEIVPGQSIRDLQGKSMHDVMDLLEGKERKTESVD